MLLNLTTMQLEEKKGSQIESVCVDCGVILYSTKHLNQMLMVDGSYSCLTEAKSNSETKQNKIKKL